MSQEQVTYVQALDAVAARQEDPQWQVAQMVDHKVKKHRGYRTLMAKVDWMTGPSSWVDFHALKAHDPYSLIQYASSRSLEKHPDFKWTEEFLEDTAKLEEVRKAHVKQAEKKFRIKFGVEVPKTMREAIYLDARDGTTVWRDAIAKELKQINDYGTFRLPKKGESLQDYNKIPYHFVFDVKFDLRRKARLVAGGNQTDEDKEDSFAGVVGMDTVRIAFVLAAMNDLHCCAADIGNAYLYGITKEKVFVRAGPEFGDWCGKPLIIHKGLYGLRSSGAQFHEHLAAKLATMGFKPSYFDSNLWMRDARDHYEYITTYVDDVLAFGKDPLALIEELRRDYILKEVGRPEYYLGGNVVELSPESNREGLFNAISSETYIRNVTEKFESLLNTPFKMMKTPMNESYHPELEESPLLNSEDHTLFCALIGSANWMITLGRFDIAYAISSLSRFSMAPRKGHLEALYRVFGYLKKFPSGKVIIDPHPMTFTDLKFEEYDWTQFYPDAAEEIPPNMPKPKGKPVYITCYVDADHAHDKVTWRSVSGIVAFVNGTPVKWSSKRQPTVESSSYGSEMVCGRQGTEMVMALRYGLCMMGVPVQGPSILLGDNMLVVVNTTLPSSQLKKKHNTIAYHRVCEAIAARVLKFAHIPSADNLADVLTKPLPAGRFHDLMQPVLFKKPKCQLEAEGTEKDLPKTITVESMAKGE